MEDQEMVVRATKSQIEDAKESFFWKDIVRELETWKVGFNKEREGVVDEAQEYNLTTATVLLHFGHIEGRIKAVDYLLALPDVFISMLEDQKENKDDS